AALRTAEDAAVSRRTSTDPAPSSSVPPAGQSQPAPTSRPSAPLTRPSTGRPAPAPWTSGGTPGPAAGGPHHGGGHAGRPQPQPPQPSRPAAPPQPAPVAQHNNPPLPQRDPSYPAQPDEAGSGLPVRRRGATLVPGSIPGAEEAGRAGGPVRRPADAGNVASTLSNLQRGVSRGRQESGGWVPKRPSDSERSNQ